MKWLYKASDATNVLAILLVMVVPNDQQFGQLALLVVLSLWVPLLVVKLFDNRD